VTFFRKLEKLFINQRYELDTHNRGENGCCDEASVMVVTIGGVSYVSGDFINSCWGLEGETYGGELFSLLYFADYLSGMW
jgi:hypothetical protein